mmetsp:Transcript_30239/g.50901  ORF Transcript_30239/g.50901 Transcript_30239/m.50901 type:complete len:148 (-) Transcript_30239:64-507(-)
MSSSWLPSSTTIPLSTTTMRSAFWMVLRRCAMTMTVRLTIMLSMASCTTASLSASSADVASSSSSTCGFLTNALAMATRCFCPPLSCVPFSPHVVSYPCGMPRMNSCALASFAAASISKSEGAHSAHWGPTGGRSHPLNDIAGRSAS